MKETPEEKLTRETQEGIEKLAKEEEQARVLQEEADAETKRLDDIEKNRVDSISIKGVVLVGSNAQKKGTHSVFLTPNRTIIFIDGKANVRADDEGLLKKLGHIE